MRTAIITVLLGSPLFASDVRELRRGTPCSWDALFMQGTAVEPCGCTRGTVLYAEGHLPKVKARMQNSVWKGKHFDSAGSFINRWLGGVEAVRASVCVGESLLDGQPCIVMQYTADAKVFGGRRDELRQIGPGLWLGRAYEGNRVVNYFTLESR